MFISVDIDFLIAKIISICNKYNNNNQSSFCLLLLFLIVRRAYTTAQFSRVNIFTKSTPLIHHVTSHLRIGGRY